MLLQPPIDSQRARNLAAIDGVVGHSAGALFVVGCCASCIFEKRAAYYFGYGAFIAKLVLFGVIALVSIHPTLTLNRWRRAAARGEALEVRA